jgi:predicted tellurium resistance membrane protein TerC
MFEWIASPEAWLALVTLTALEIVLGIDNIIFLSILVGRLPEAQRDRARFQGLALAMLTRIGLLLSLAWMMRLTTPFVSVVGQDISGRDLILLLGGLFLLWKSAQEIWDSLEGAEGETAIRPASSYWMVLGQIAIIDIVFSLDSVITAVGLAEHLWVMVTAIVLAIGVMMFAARPIGEFVEEHPTVKMLALSFLVLVGVALVAEGTGHEMPKGYLYFAMAFSFLVEMLNLRLRRKAAPAPVHLHQIYDEINQEDQHS